MIRRLLWRWRHRGWTLDDHMEEHAYRHAASQFDQPPATPPDDLRKAGW